MNGVATARAGGCRRGRAPMLRPAALSLTLALTLLLAAAVPCAPALSQSRSRPWRKRARSRPSRCPPAIAAEPASQAAFPIRVGPPDAVPRNSFVRVRGLPPMAALSEGHSIGPGSWAVSLAALPELKITLPAGSRGPVRHRRHAGGHRRLGAGRGQDRRWPFPPAGRPRSRREPATRPAPAAATILRAGVPEGAERRAPPPPPARSPRPRRTASARSGS